MLIEMITLEPPYNECSSVLEIMSSKEQIKLPESLFRINDYNVFKFICKCLVPVPELRPSAKDLLEDKDYFSDDKEGDKAYIMNEEKDNYKQSDVYKIWKEHFNYDHQISRGVVINVIDEVCESP